MLKPVQTKLEIVTLKQWEPKGYSLRLLDQHIRFDFIREATQNLYGERNDLPGRF